MTKKQQEIVFGYLFALPVLCGVLLFTVYPMATSFWYSLTSYNPLAAHKDRISINLEEEVLLITGADRESARDPEAFSAVFDPAVFIAEGLMLHLDEAQYATVSDHFDSERFAGDLAAGKLDTVTDGVEALSPYLGRYAGSVFPKYKPAFAGFTNFVRMFTADQYFWIVLRNTLSYAVIVVSIQTFIAILLAVAANAKIPGITFFKIVFFIPAITSSSAISMIFWMIYSRPGVLNQILGLFGAPQVDWLNNPGTALPAVMALNIWTTAGFFMVAFLAGLQNIPKEMYEAADIDGAGRASVFWRITVPLLRPQILYVMIMGTIGCMQVFDQIYYLCGTNMRNATIAFYIYKNAFFFGEMGYASAIALVLFAFILCITALQRKLVKESLV